MHICNFNQCQVHAKKLTPGGFCVGRPANAVQDGDSGALQTATKRNGSNRHEGEEQTGERSNKTEKQKRKGAENKATYHSANTGAPAGAAASREKTSSHIVRTKHRPCFLFLSLHVLLLPQGSASCDTPVALRQKLDF